VGGCESPAGSASASTGSIDHETVPTECGSYAYPCAYVTSTTYYECHVSYEKRPGHLHTTLA
jgi:hypothetical protein